MPKNRRVLAHYVVCCGQVYRNAILVTGDDGCRVEPYREETESTFFFSGMVAVCRGNEGLKEEVVSFLNDKSRRSAVGMEELAHWLVDQKKCVDTDKGNTCLLAVASDGRVDVELE